MINRRSDLVSLVARLFREREKHGTLGAAIEGGVLKWGTGRIEFTSRFYSNSSTRCSFIDCTVEWFFEQRVSAQGKISLAVDWTKKTCTRFDGEPFYEENPAPIRLPPKQEPKR